MLIKLAFLLILTPIFEIVILIQVKNSIGLTWTIGMVLLTGFTGALMLRYEGFGVLKRIQATLSRGQMPTAEIVDGALILIGGMTLLTPGFLTDLIGFIILTPWSRQRLLKALLVWLRHKVERGEVVIRPL